jgi:hypothetical protein
MLIVIQTRMLWIERVLLHHVRQSPRPLCTRRFRHWIAAHDLRVTNAASRTRSSPRSTHLEAPFRLAPALGRALQHLHPILLSTHQDGSLRIEKQSTPLALQVALLCAHVLQRQVLHDLLLRHHNRSCDWVGACCSPCSSF